MASMPRDAAAFAGSPTDNAGAVPPSSPTGASPMDDMLDAIVAPVPSVVAQEPAAALIRTGSGVADCLPAVTQRRTITTESDATESVVAQHYASIQVPGMSVDNLVSAFADVRMVPVVDTAAYLASCAPYDDDDGTECEYSETSTLPEELISLGPVSVSGDTLVVHCGYSGASVSNGEEGPTNGVWAETVTFYWRTL